MSPLRRFVQLALSTVMAGGLVAATSAAPAEAVIFRTTFSQTTPILVGDGGHGPDEGSFAVPDSGPAADYPSRGTFSDGAGRPIIDVDVYIHLNHTRPDDLELLVVGPGGQQALLMANAGGGTDFDGEVIFDDEAAAAIPDDAALVDHARYNPAAYAPVPLPAPAPPLNGNRALSVFDGTSAVGEWSMYAFDDEALDSGDIYWSVHIQTATASYPSSIPVSGLGSVTDVDVNLSGVTSDYPADLDLMLVGPHGQQATLMSDVGGGSEISGASFTVDDEATSPFPHGAALVSGSYQPANADHSEDVYPAPAPATTGTTELSVFDGTDPNGTWRLFAWDSVGGDYTTINGWSLDIESSDAASPSGTVSIAAAAAAVRSPAVTLTLAATDPGPGTGTQQMRFSNDGTTWSPFRPYAAATPWTLAPGRDGARTVFAQFRDGVGNLSPVVSDAITLKGRAPRVIKVKPRRDRTGVQPSAKVKVIASERLAPTSVSSTSVVLTRKGAGQVKAALTVRGAKIILVPARRLKPGEYRVHVTSKVTDLAGNAFDAKPKKRGTQALTWTFHV